MGAVRAGRPGTCAAEKLTTEGIGVQHSSLFSPLAKAQQRSAAWKSGALAPLVPFTAFLFRAKSGAPPLAFSRQWCHFTCQLRGKMKPVKCIK